MSSANPGETVAKLILFLKRLKEKVYK